MTSVDVHFSAIHPYSGDLNVDINDAAISRNYDLWANEGGSADNPSRTRTGVTSFNGLAVNGTWYLYARDTTALDAGYIDEWWIRIYYTDTRPDLIARNLSVSDATPNGGDSITVYFNVKNQGGSLAGASYQAIVISDNTTITTSDTELASEYTGPLFAGGDTNETNYGVRIPDCATGRKYLGIIVDETGAVDESDENNNNDTYIPVDVPSPVTVSGTIRFNDRNYDRNGFTTTTARAASNVRVRILDSSDTALASLDTNSSGYFTTVVPCLYPGESFKVMVLAAGSWGTVGASDTTVSAGTRTFAGSGSSVGASWTIDDSTPVVREALSILDSLRRGSDYAASVDDQSVSPGSVHVNTSTGCGQGGATPCYSTTDDRILMPANYGEVDDVVLHEYGHHIMYSYTTIPPVGGQHFFCQNAVSAELAFSEGWATYFGAATQGKDWMAGWPENAPGSAWFELEEGSTVVNASQCAPVTPLYEGSVMSVLWDSRDGGTNESFDLVSNEPRVFDVIDDDWDSRSTSPTVADFRTAWGAALDSIMCRYTGTNCTLSATLTATPSSGNAPLNGVDLTASVGGSAQGTINYTYYCNRSDAGTNITSGYAAKYDGTSVNPRTAVDVCSYPSPGTYVAKVIVERGTLAAEARRSIVVSQPPPPCYSLTLARNTSSGGGAPTASPPNSSGCGNGLYVAGANISVNATPSVGWSVGGWIGTQNNGSTATTNSVVMPASNHTVQVNYVPNRYRLYVSRQGSGGGSVSSSPGGISCPTDCEEHYVFRSQVTLYPAAATGSYFAGWATGSHSDCSDGIVVMDGDRTCVARFEQSGSGTPCYSLSLARNVANGGAVPTANPSSSPGCASGSYHGGAQIQVSASPAAGWSTEGWAGTQNDQSTSSTNSVIMPTAAHTVTVNYVQGPSAAGLDFYTVTPCRLIDTRSANSLYPPGWRSSVQAIQVTGQCGVSVLAQAVAMNVTIIAPPGGGHLSLAPWFYTLPPSTSTINFQAGQVRANNTVMSLWDDGSLRVYFALGVDGPVHYAIDIFGYFE